MAPDSGSQSWQPVHAVRTHELVIRQVRDLIGSGSLKPGDRLPAERDLAEQLGVSRPSVREALRVLEALGVIGARRGLGTDGGTLVLSEPSDALAGLFDLEFALARFTADDVIHTRIMLERWALRNLPDGADLSEAATVLERTREAGLSRVELAELDLDFHAALVRAAGNGLVLHIYRSLCQAMLVRLVETLEVMTDEQWLAFWPGITSQHSGILSSASSAELLDAADQVERHITDHYLRSHP